MTVGELIEQLKQFDPNLRVKRYNADNTTYEDMNDLTQDNVCEDFYKENEDGEIWVRRNFRHSDPDDIGTLCSKGDKLIKFLGI